MLRFSLLPALLVAVGALVVPPSAEAVAPDHGTVPSGAPAPEVVTRVDRVHLITGDTVRVQTRADGRLASTIVAGPHAGGTVARWSTHEGSFVLPEIPAAERLHLDSSLFDVSRLVSMTGARVPVRVTVRRQATAGALDALGRGLGLHDGFLRSAGRHAVPASYAATSTGLGPRALAAVRSIRLAGPTSPAAATDTDPALTVQVQTAAGRPAQGVYVMIQDVDEPNGFMAEPTTDRTGKVTVHVPAGDYGIIAWSFERLAVVPEVSVSDDSTVAADMGAATVRPQVSVPHHKLAEAVLSIGRSPEGDSYGLPLQFSGPRFDMRVQPVSGEVAHGSLHTGVSAKLVPTARSGARDALAVTADVSSGVPADLTYTHHRRDFARVVQRFYGNGPAGPRQTSVDAMGTGADMFTGQEYDTPMPGRRLLLLQATRDAWYQQTAFPQAGPDSNNITQLIDVRRYPRPGRTYRTTFAHGPVGPGIEDGAGPFLGVTRSSGHLVGYLPLFSGAGRTMLSYVAARDGQWSLRQGARVLDRGRHQVAFDVPVPPGRRTYLLHAVSHPTAASWKLSTRVDDTWRFQSRRGRRTPPLLTPSYLPPSTMAGYVEPGRTSFRLTFAAPSGSDHRITRATVRLSTDGGRHWRAAHVRRVAARAFRVGYLDPAAHDGHRRVSLQVTGRDGHGDSVRETAIDVYRLR